ncbi:MAG: UbiA family prenyltransferase [Desulfosalsimonadaceae bacterium]
MNTITRAKIDRIKLFLALSRTPHGLLDMATPAFAVLLYLQGFPSPAVIGIGLLTAFAGYTAVYAFNDIIDMRADRKKLEPSERETGSYIDSIMVRHPLAQGLLNPAEGAAWALGWSAVALVGAFLLNPVCALIFLAGAALETLYCMLWQISPLRAIVSGFVKNMGAVAALYAVDPHPSPGFALLLFACLFFWEIGGQNIPADWEDIERDRRFHARTIPVQLGEKKAAALAFACLLLAAALFAALFFLHFSGTGFPAALLVLAASLFLLLIPGARLYKSRMRPDAMALFNRASYFPAVMLAAVLALIV